MENIYFFGKADVTLLVLYAFWAFFGTLVLYLLREGRREGFPLEHDVTGRLEPMPDLIVAADVKTFTLADGSQLNKPDGVRDTHVTNLARTAAWSGSPFEPVGDPMQASVGPGSYAMRADRPDVTSHGITRLAPLRISGDYHLDRRDPDPRGRKLVGVDGAVGGTVIDVWIDRAEFLVRYLEVETKGADGAAKHVLIPYPMCVIARGADTVVTDSVTGAQVAGAPLLANPDQITLREEERVVGYFGGGYLYATANRSQPVL